jgi:hypothetical protein
MVGTLAVTPHAPAPFPELCSPDSAGPPEIPLSAWLVDQAICPEYDAYVAAHPQGTLFHRLEWRAALIDSGAGAPFYLMVMAGYRVAGVLPMLERNTERGRVLESLPHTPVAGVLADDARAARFLLGWAARLAQQRSVAALVLRSLAALPRAGGQEARSWTRLPLAALRGGVSGPTGGTPPMLERAAFASLDGAQLAALTRKDPTIGVLAAWRGRSHSEPVCLIERTGPSIVRLRAVCVTQGDVARVFDLVETGHSGGARLVVLREVAAMVSATCRWIECSLSPRERAALTTGGLQRAVRVALQQSFRPAELLGLLAARSG